MRIRISYIKDIYQRFVHEECFEEQCDQDLALPKDQEYRIEPGQAAMEEREECDLGEVCKSE